MDPRRSLRIRLAAWGTVLVMAVLAFTLRAGATDEVDHGANGPQLDGRTAQGQPIWAVLEDGRVREIRMVWELRCDDGSRLDPFGVQARDGVESFRHERRGFTFEERRDLPRGDGSIANVHARIVGTTATSGTASAEIRFRRDGDDGPECRSGPVRWRVAARSSD